MKLGKQPICKNYLIANGFKNNYAILVALFIFMPFNALFLTVSSPLVHLIGFNYSTIERNVVSLTIFICFIANSCLVPILLSGNFSVDYPGGFFDQMFSIGGRSGDFDGNWYRDTTSQLTSAIIVLSIQPVLLFVGELCYLKLDRWYKKNIKYIKHDNNKLDNIKFLEMNAGPDYPF